jgi:hypothetical protein
VLKNKSAAFAPPRRARFAALRAYNTTHKMGVTTRAAARKAQAEATKLLDLPDAVLEHILVAASDGGHLGELRAARLACSRLRAAADAAARIASVSLVSLNADALKPLSVLPRFGRLTRLQLELHYGPEKEFDDHHTFDVLFQTAFDMASYLEE